MRQFAEGLGEKPKENDADLNDESLEVHYMSSKDRTKYKIEKEKKKLSELSGGEKVRYLIDYYKWHVIITVIVLFSIVSIGRAIYLNSIPGELSVAILNATFDDTKEKDAYKEALSNEYREFYQVPKKHAISFEPDYTIDPEKYEESVSQTSSSTLTDYETLSYKIQNNIYDALIMDSTAFEYCCKMDLVYKLDSYFEKDVIDRISDRLVKHDNVSGESVYLAIDISDTEFAKSLKIEDETIYLCVSCAKKHNVEHAEKLLNYILDWGIDYSEDK